ncbi:histidinol dehydrogenase [Segatella baroniae F0067]|uniref:Histidinol dehydrogenase n=2 Tax=Segatella baroniae TaxID=305719 RepID=U2QKE0_9BACT|nr:histidinol dehydrogenase [Segatella baroniae]ERK39287.1 histidinol dehydrogenase [Segatella baroniae F0067]
MNILKYPDRALWKDIVKRPKFDLSSLRQTVEKVLNDIREHGDQAILQYEERFDHVSLDSLAVSRDEMDEADGLVPSELKAALTLAHANIAKFHRSQKFHGERVETTDGVTCWQESVAIEKVGLYIPGGTAPLFSTVLMLATPANIAGCQDIVLCTPPEKTGKVNPAILAAAKISGVSKIFKIGGIQAIGAMAYGTESVPKVYKIFGPGNQYVMAAKQMVSLHDVAIDMPAGPSEVCVVADATSVPAYVAADLLSQAEHGIDSQVMLLCTDEKVLKEVEQELQTQLERLPRKDIARQALDNSNFVLTRDLDEAMELSNLYAPEHLILSIADWQNAARLVVNAGSVFLGHFACESAGDYASGTNHTLPTHGYAVAYSGVNLDSYTRKITFQHIDKQGVRAIGPAVVAMAEGEGLEAHAHAMRIRLNDLK